MLSAHGESEGQAGRGLKVELRGLTEKPEEASQGYQGGFGGESLQDRKDLVRGVVVGGKVWHTKVLSCSEARKGMQSSGLSWDPPDVLAVCRKGGP